MSTTALTTAGRFLVRRKRPNRPSVDNASRRSWCPHHGVRFRQSISWFNELTTVRELMARLVCETHAALTEIQSVLKLVAPYSGDRELVMDILRHGEHVEVLAPEALRARVKAKLCAAVKTYG